MSWELILKKFKYSNTHFHMQQTTELNEVPKRFEKCYSLLTNINFKTSFVSIMGGVLAYGFFYYILFVPFRVA